ncbi:MAG: hypothetical protein ACR2J8_10190 [Thermomicrobiales bacterium]
MPQTIGAVNNLKTMMNVLREVSFDDIREDALRTPRMLIFGPTAYDARWFADQLLGVEGGEKAITRDLSGSIDDLGTYDLIVVYDPDGDAERVGLNQRIRALGMTPPIFRHGGLGAHEAARIDALRLEIARRMGDRITAVGRAFPAMRAAAAKVTIDETAVANAQFALVSNIPAILPFVGGFAAAGADFIVLTKNQVMMIYKLAAIYGRDLSEQTRIIQEIAPVVGVGFAWRTLAREAAAFLPFAAGTVPKVAVAYAGTTVAGRAAEFYYRTNRKPSKEQLAQYTEPARDSMAKFASRITKKNAPGAGPVHLDD